jgi:hypothetical protein
MAASSFFFKKRKIYVLLSAAWLHAHPLQWQVQAAGCMCFLLFWRACVPHKIMLFSRMQCDAWIYFTSFSCMHVPKQFKTAAHACAAACWSLEPGGGQLHV